LLSGGGGSGMTLYRALSPTARCNGSSERSVFYKPLKTQHYKHTGRNHNSPTNAQRYVGPHVTTTAPKLCRRLALYGKPVAELRSVTCHNGNAQCVLRTCHLTCWDDIRKSCLDVDISRLAFFAL